MNLKAVDNTLANLHPVTVPNQVDSQAEFLAPVPAIAPEFVRNVLGEIIAGRGDLLPVSKMPCDGTFPTGTARWEKRISMSLRWRWGRKTSTRCGRCSKRSLTMVRRWSSPTAIALPMVTTWLEVAALPVRPATRGGRAESAAIGLVQADAARRKVSVDGKPVQDAHQKQTRPSHTAVQNGPGGCPNTLPVLRVHGEPKVCSRSHNHGSITHQRLI